MVNIKDIQGITIPLPPHPNAEYFITYTNRLRHIDSLYSLQKMAEYWRPLANDAYEIVQTLNDETFLDFTRGVREELELNRYAGTIWYNKYIRIFSPDVLFVIDTVAKAHDIPWGTAYNRLLTLGGIIVDEAGIIHYVGAQK